MKSTSMMAKFNLSGGGYNYFVIYLSDAGKFSWNNIYVYVTYLNSNIGSHNMDDTVRISYGLPLVSGFIGFFLYFIP